jgi:hypothetical protein
LEASLVSAHTDAPALQFSHNVIEHLGIKLYRNKSANVLAELVANCWDADAQWVNVELDPSGGKTQNGSILISDNGVGMTFDHIRDHYLVVGKAKRHTPNQTSPGGRHPMGRKGLGKLAPFGIANRVDVVTAKDGLLNWFTLELGEILKQSTDGSGRYPPKFHANNVDVNSTITTGDPYLDEKVREFQTKIKSNGEAGGSGTIVCLTQIASNQLPASVDIVRELGSRFTVVLLRDDFQVHVDGTRITEDDALPKFELRIPTVGGNKISYWVGFVGTAEWSSDEAGVGIFAHGKIAQTRPFFFNKKGKEVFQRYLYGVISADWIDEQASDLISTDRTSIDWSDEQLAELYHWGQKQVSAWITEYERFRRDKQDAEVSVQARDLRASGRANTYSPAENAQIDALVSEATREIGKSAGAMKTREELLIAVSRAWINQPTRRLLGSLWAGLLDKSATPEMLQEMVEKLSDNSVPEAMGLALTFAQRAYALTVLGQLAHERSETNLQQLVVKFPWIIQPRGDLLTADKQLKTTVDKLAQDLTDAARVGSIIKGMTDAQRADFVFLTDAQTKVIEVVEIKKPNLTLTIEEDRQLTDYLHFLQTTNPSAHITGVLIGNATQGFDVSHKNAIVKTWDQILRECRATYVELLASMLHVADVPAGDSRIEVIKNLGGEATWQLLNRLAEGDDELSAIIGSVGVTGVPS